jgi:secreted trypsin-like serine protease
MKKLHGISVVGMACISGLLGACAAPSDGEPEAEGESSSRIIGGVADSGDPAVVGIVALQGPTSGALCTGEIISPHYVLTASHCVDPTSLGFTPVKIVVVTSPDALNPPSKANVLAIAEATTHPAFNPNTGDNDVAVIELAAPTDIPPLPINSKPLTAAVNGTTTRVVGYGRTIDGDPNSAGKKYQANLVLSELQPTTFLVSALPATQCHGDSGGPVLMPIDGQETIIGIGWHTESGVETCVQGVRDTRVDVQAGWIESFLVKDGVFPVPPALQGFLNRRR